LLELAERIERFLNGKAGFFVAALFTAISDEFGSAPILSRGAHKNIFVWGLWRYKRANEMLGARGKK
jgi:hypothetical protein